MATVNEIKSSIESKMHKSVDALKVDLAAVRTGRATPSLLDKITVEYYGTPTPIPQVASVSVPEARMLVIKPWDPSSLKAIEKAIQTSDLGLNPNNDGSVIRLNLPMLTEERRKELVKTVHKKAEETRIALRNLRRDANEAIKKAEKAKQITEDDSESGLEDIQKLTDKIMKDVDAVVARKEKEVMEV
jgi:ribosome recycling factor